MPGRTNRGEKAGRKGGAGTGWVHTSGALALCLLNAALLWPGHRATSASRTDEPARLPRLVSRWHPGAASNAAEAALLEARHWRVKAMLLVNQEREAMETWDPHAADGVNQETLRRQLMARDRGGYLYHARRVALRALALARSPAEVYRVTQALACIECESGNHQAELHLARKQSAMAPGDWMASMVLHRAERCNHLSPSPTRSTGAALPEPKTPAPLLNESLSKQSSSPSADGCELSSRQAGRPGKLIQPGRVY